MSSTLDARLARIGEAIDELAAAARAQTGEPASVHDLAGRLAGVWAMVAELDPALAMRLPGYCPDGE